MASQGSTSTGGVISLGGGNTGYTGGGGNTGFVADGGSGGGGVLVQKHIYVHVAPEEPEEIRHQQAIAAAQATKHYKIIFIKAPSPPSYIAPHIQAQAQNQEKTLVYVLVRKPDEQQDITIPTAAALPPSKPEVYFIRYKAKAEATGGGTILQPGTSGYTGNIGVNLNGGSTGNFGITSGAGSTATTFVRPSTNYGPPGHSGSY